MHDFDLLVIGSETEGCLAAVAAARAGASVGLLPTGNQLGGLLTENGLAYVDRDSRHLKHPAASPEDGIFGQFLDQAGVQLVSLEPRRGHFTLSRMLDEAKVEVLPGFIREVRVEGDRLSALTLDHTTLSAHHFLDATPDGDLAEMAGIPFQQGFRAYGISRFLGVSPLPRVIGVSPGAIMETCERLALEPELEDLRLHNFGERRFLALEHGVDYLLIGPPHLGLAYQRWREKEGLAFPFPFEADGFNIAILGPDTTSWNGLIYFSEDPETLLRWSRGGDPIFAAEMKVFERFLREGLGWADARVELPGLYVRQTRHALGTLHQVTLAGLTRCEGPDRVGTFSYYPDFRGFEAVCVPCPLVAPVSLGAGLFKSLKNLGIASRAGGYTPFAHSLCRLVQYNVTLGSALGIAAALGNWGEVPANEIREELRLQGFLADDPTNLERNRLVQETLRGSPLFSLETHPR